MKKKSKFITIISGARIYTKIGMVCTINSALSMTLEGYQQVFGLDDIIKIETPTKYKTVYRSK